MNEVPGCQNIYYFVVFRHCQTFWHENCTKTNNCIRIDKKLEPDLIILDFLRGNIDEHKLLREVHKRSTNAAVILATGPEGILRPDEAISHRIYVYLHKPISPAEVELLLLRLI